MLIVVDGACDLSPTMRARPDVTVVPFRISSDGVPYVGDDEQFAKLLRSETSLTSAPPGNELFSAAFAEHRDIVVVGTSTYLSSAVDNAALGARRAFADVRIVDTRTFSAGSGLIAEALLDAIEDGTSVSELGHLGEMIVESTHSYAIVDQRDLLVGRGLLGRTRLSRVFRHPVLGVRDRARLMHQSQSRKRAVEWLVQHAYETAQRAPAAWAVAHMNASDVDEVVSTFRDVFRSEPRFVTTMNPTAAIHLGMNAVVIAVRAP